MFTILSSLATFVWLSVATWNDLRTHTVPNWLTTLPLIVITVVASLLPLIAPDLPGPGIIPGALLATILAIDTILPQPFFRIALSLAACSAAAYLFPAWIIIPVVWGVVYTLNQLNISGGADAKLAMTLIVMYPSLILALSIVGVKILISLAVVAVRYRHLAPIVLLDTARDAVSLRFPGEAELKERGTPFAFAFLLAFLVYTIWRVAA